MSMNIAILRGRLTRDPEAKTTQSGNNVCRFTLAVDRQRKEDGADFVPCIAWNKTADVITQYCSKGRQIEIVGRLSVRNYEDKDGNKRTATEVVVSSMDFISDGTRKVTTNDDAFAGGDEDEEVPF